MVVPEVVSDSDMVIMARDISKQIEDADGISWSDQG